MRDDIPLTRDLLLIGGGHAHALVLRRWGMDPLAGARVTVIDPNPAAAYSGMLPGHVAGHYERDALDIDLVRLARFAGARLILAAVTGIDAEARLLTLSDGRAVPYDVASLDIGITSRMPDLAGFAAHGTPAKPLDAFADRWETFLAEATSGAVASIGGGVAGVELALAAAHALRGAGRDPQVTVIDAGTALTGLGPRAAARLRAAMAAAGVRLCEHARVAEVGPDAVTLGDGTRVASAFTIGAAGARPHDWLGDTGLPLHEGYVRVGPTLQVEGRPDLFAAGDCAHLTHAPRAKAGVFAVRAAPVLHANLRAALRGAGRMRTFRPQRGYLKLVSLGGRSALGERFGLSVSGPWVWRWKDRIDRRFMARVGDLAPMRADPPPRDAAAGVAEAMAGRQPLCAGCGSKVAAPALAAALASLPLAARPDLLAGPGDDAAVLEAGDGVQVLTTDHLRAFTADPALFARIATVHALGDVWAMGAAPQAGLATVILPPMSERLQARTLTEMLAAASDVLRAAGAELAGGHSLIGAEMAFGLSVTGLAPAAIRAGGARPGDALILTKALGSGTVLAAEMAMRARGRDVVAALDAMARPQGDAAAVLAGAHAMTDVTGFGLAGHLLALCRAAGVGAQIVLADLPLLPGAEALAAAGIRSTLHAANAAAAPVEGAIGPRGALLHDPQTAGGLLAAVAPDAAEATLAALRAFGLPAARIGTVTEGPPAIRCV